MAINLGNEGSRHSLQESTELILKYFIIGYNVHQVMRAYEAECSLAYLWNALRDVVFAANSHYQTRLVFFG